MARFASARSFVLAALAAAALACTSPTLPLPPPALPSVTTGSTPGTYKLSSLQGSEPNALIIIVNRNTDLPRNKRVTGTIADNQGSWDVDVVANPDDTLDITQEVGAVGSPVTTVTVK